MVRRSRKTCKFQLTAARRRLVVTYGVMMILMWFQLTAARRRLGFALA